MKQISLFFIALLFSISSSAQLPNESFESWTTGQGPANWKLLQNNIGTTTQWTQTVAGFTFTPPHTGQFAAYLNSQNVLTGIPEDYLVTPSFNAPVNGQIIFYSRLTQVLDQGSVYKVKILPAGADENDIASYVELQSWTELEINPQQTEYTKITVPVPVSYEGTNIRVAFVILSDNGDRWIIDDVSVTSQCLNPENLSASNITTTSADLSWDNPSGATEWEIEVQEGGSPTTGTGVVYNGTLPYHVAGLTPGVPYKFLVKALCSDGGQSDFIGAYNFVTFKPGDNCTYPKMITSLPYINSENTSNYFNPYQGYNGGCGIPTWQSYLNGNDIVYSYTATQTGNISINVTGITDAYAGIFVYTSCADIGTSCYAGAVNEDPTPAPDLNIPTMSVTAGTTYYIVISSWFAQSIGYTLNIQQELCERPTDLTVSNPTFNGASLSWTSSLTSWEYVLQPLGTGLPTGSGTAITTATLTPTSLTPTSQYEFYVRANCGNGTFSSWAGPLKFNTLCSSFPVPYFEGFNSDTTSEFCWNTADINNDGNTWNTNFAGVAFEGDQSAYFTTNGSNDNNDMLISPAIILSGNERLKFRYKTQTAGAVAFKVLASTTGTAPEDFTIELSPLASYGVDEFTEKVINVSNLPAGIVRFAWQVPAGINGGTELIIDNIIVEPMPACGQPTDIVGNNISITGADISWTPGNTETAWEIIVGEPSVIGTPGNNSTGTPLTVSNYTASGLTANTIYGVYVRAVCGVGNKSLWEGPYYFTTKCAASPVPFFEGFNSDSATEQCWTTVNNNGDWAMWDLGVFGPFEGDEAAGLLTVNGANDDWLISPAINLTGNERLKFHYRLGNPNDGNTGFKVLLSTSNTDLTDFTEVLIPEATYTNGEYKVKTVSLQAYTGPVYIAWQVPPTAEAGPYMLIDNVIVEPIPVCPEPMYIDVSNITQTSAQVNWEAGGTETQWELLVNISGEPVPTTGTIVNALPYTLTTLPDGSPIQPGTVYQVTVKAVCGPATSSVASDSVKFVTQIANDNCGTATVVPVNSGPTCDLYASGTVNGSTASPEGITPCNEWTTAGNDVWFEFTASSSTHTISVKDILNGASSLNYVFYKGDDCNNLAELDGCYDAHAEYGGSVALLENLTVGAKYKIRVFSADQSANQTTTFNICIKTPVTPIAVNTTEHTVEQLVKEVLFNGDCAQISNITWSTGTNYPDPDNVFGDNPNGIGYFNKNNSDFPFEEGIVMTTGDVLKVPGPNYRGMEQGSAVWLGDTDIYNVMEGMLGAPPFQDNTNASVIEFDFVPSQPTFSFDFIFASEEYGDFIQCFSYDTFAVLLTDPNGNTQNIAVIPGTQTPISVFSISGAGYPNFCPGYNLPYFDKYNVFGNNDLSSTAFDGQTVVMTATSPVQVNQQYHLKIAIAETDNNLDSGVFIKGGINGSGNGSVDLGEDLLVSTNNAVCNGKTATLETNIDPAVFDFVWKRNDVVIPNQTNATLVVSEPGTYTVSANITGYDCLREDSVVVEFYEDATGNPADLTVCDPDGFAEFDIASNTAIILDGLTAANYVVSYHATPESAADNTAPLTSPYTNTVQTTQTIYARILDNTTQCYVVKSFTINAQDLTPEFTITDDFSICEGSSGTITVTPTNFNVEDALFSWTLNGAALPDTTPSITVNTQGDYVVTVSNNGCSATATVTVTVIPAPVADSSLPITACDSYLLPQLSTGNTYHTGTNGTGETLLAGSLVTESKTVFIFAQSQTTPVCTSETSFTVTINPTPEFTLEGTFTACIPQDVTITVNPSNFTIANATFIWKLDGNTLTENESSIQAEIFGEYTVTVTANGCEHTETVTIEKDETAIKVIAADNCENNVYMIEALDDNGSFNIDTASYAWEGPDNFTSDKRKFAVTLPGIYNITVTTADGCIGEAEFIVTGTTCEIPRGISPNGDHMNDELDLSTLDVKKLSIFNRYGEEVYSRNNYKKEWVGQTDKGDQLPTGTYFYMIQLQGENKTGWIYINRQE